MSESRQLSDSSDMEKDIENRDEICSSPAFSVISDTSELVDIPVSELLDETLAYLDLMNCDDLLEEGPCPRPLSPMSGSWCSDSDSDVSEIITSFDQNVDEEITKACQSFLWKQFLVKLSDSSDMEKDIENRDEICSSPAFSVISDTSELVDIPVSELLDETLAYLDLMNCDDLLEEGPCPRPLSPMSGSWCSDSDSDVSEIITSFDQNVDEEITKACQSFLWLENLEKEPDEIGDGAWTSETRSSSKRAIKSEESTRPASSASSYSTSIAINKAAKMLISQSNEPAKTPEATEPVKTLEDSEPVKTLEDTEPVKTLEDTEPVKTIEDTEPVKTLEDTEPVKTLEDTEPVKTLEDTEPVKTLEDTEPVKTLEDTEPVKTLEDTEPVKTLEDTEPVKTLEDTEPVKTLEDTEPVKTLEDTEPVKTLEDTEPVKTLEDTEPIKTLEDTEPVKTLEDTEPIKTLEDTEPVKTLEDTEPVKTLEDTEPVKTLEDTEPVKKLEDTEPVKKLEDTEPVKKLEDTEPVKNLKDTEPVKTLVAKPIQTLDVPEPVKTPETSPLQLVEEEEGVTPVEMMTVVPSSPSTSSLPPAHQVDHDSKEETKRVVCKGKKKSVWKRCFKGWQRNRVQPAPNEILNGAVRSTSADLKSRSTGDSKEGSLCSQETSSTTSCSAALGANLKSTLMYQSTHSDKEDDKTSSQSYVDQSQPDSECPRKKQVDVEETQAKKSGCFSRFFHNIFSKVKMPGKKQEDTEQVKTLEVAEPVKTLKTSPLQLIEEEESVPPMQMIRTVVPDSPSTSSLPQAHQVDEKPQSQNPVLAEADFSEEIKSPFSQEDKEAAADWQLVLSSSTITVLIRRFFQSLSEEQWREIGEGIYNPDVKEQLNDMCTDVLTFISNSVAQNVLHTFHKGQSSMALKTSLSSAPLTEFFGITESNMQKSLKTSISQAFSHVVGADTPGRISPKFTEAMAGVIIDEVNSVLSVALQASHDGGSSSITAADSCLVSKDRAAKKILEGAIITMKSFITGRSTAVKRNNGLGHDSKEETMREDKKKSHWKSCFKRWQKKTVHPAPLEHFNEAVGSVSADLIFGSTGDSKQVSLCSQDTSSTTSNPKSTQLELVDYMENEDQTPEDTKIAVSSLSATSLIPPNQESVEVPQSENLEEADLANPMTDEFQEEMRTSLSYQLTHCDKDDDKTSSQSSVDQSQPDSECPRNNHVDVEETKAKQSSRFSLFSCNIFSKNEKDKKASAENLSEQPPFWMKLLRCSSCSCCVDK